MEKSNSMARKAGEFVSATLLRQEDILLLYFRFRTKEDMI